MSAPPELLEHAPTAEALRATFGDAPIESVAALLGGRSGARVARITVAGRAYVLRRVAEHNTRADVERQFACMTIAAERGVAPRVLFTDAAGGVSITAFVDGPPLGAFFRGERAADELATLFRRLHEGPPFPRAFDVATLTHDVLAGLTPPPVSRALVEEIRAALAPHRSEAPCHHDPNPSNLVYDGERLYLVDWETACAGDPTFDLAAFGLFIRSGPTFRERLLGAYHGRVPTEVERSRMVLSRALALAYYATVSAHVAARSPEPPGPSEATVPDLAAALVVIAESATWGPSWLSRVFAGELAREQGTPAYAAALAALR